MSRRDACRAPPYLPMQSLKVFFVAQPGQRSSMQITPQRFGFPIMILGLGEPPLKTLTAWLKTVSHTEHLNSMRSDKLGNGSIIFIRPHHKT